MTWAVVWFDQAAEDLRRLHWETAARIDEAVQRLATTNEGPLRRVLINGVVETRLLVPPYAAIVSLDRRARLLKVWAIVRYAS
jgi:hypothetical protein